MPAAARAAFLAGRSGLVAKSVREDAKALQKGSPLGGRERVERGVERAIAAFEPGLYALRGQRVEVDDRPAPVVDVLAAAHERPLLELTRELARSRQGEPQLARDVADGAGTLRADVRQDRDVARGQPRLAAEELELGAAPPPEASQDRTERLAQLPQLLLVPSGLYHLITVIER
jgi:hypothetical protein